MKSIKQQYIDLQEGRMTQQNFMRNLRMSMPQYVTNVTSYNDSIKILKNKGILTEADMRAIPAELAKGIKVEMEHTDDVEVAKKIAMDHLAENPNYYSDLEKSGVDTAQGLKVSSDETTLEPNMNRANPKDGFSLGFFEENQDEAPKTKIALDKLAAMPVDRISDERRAELKAKIEAERERRKKAGLQEAKDEKGRWTNASGKSMYDQFKEIDNLNGQEVLIGIDYEMEKNEELTKVGAAKIVLKNLKKNPIYYTSTLISGKEGYEPEYIGGKSAQPEANQMQPYAADKVIDKKLGMQPVKGVEKAKKDADAKKETNKVESGVSLMSLIAKATRGVQKMDATGEKMKKVAMKEARLNDFPGEGPGKIAQQIMNYVDSNPTLKQYSDEITLQSNPDGFLRFGYWNELPADALKALELQFNVEQDFDFDEDTGRLTSYQLTPKHTTRTVDLGKADLMKMIREELREITGAYGGDAMDPEDGSSYLENN